MSSSQSPPLKLFVRSKERVELTTLPTKTTPSERVILGQGLSTFHALSPDGSKAIVQLPSGVIVCELSSGETKLTLDESTGVQCGYFSPGGSYIVTWERSQKSAEKSPPPNLKVWKASSGACLKGFHCKNHPKRLSERQKSTTAQWSPVQWSWDESRMYHGVSNEVHVYAGDDFSKPLSKIRSPNYSIFSMSPSDGRMVIFTPEVKGKPARVALRSTVGEEELVSKSFYQTEECSIEWSPAGSSALVLTQTTVDTSGESYYGSSNLFLLNESGAVPLPSNDTPLVHDAAWNPNPKTKPACFAVIRGKMPSTISLHHGFTAAPLFVFGRYHRNTICWSPHGRFLFLGGFGNMAGNVDVWDHHKKKSCGSTPLLTCAVGYGWAPSSRVFAVSVTSPRMNVENGIKVFDYTGEEVWRDEGYAPDRLLQVEFVPAPMGVYEDRAQSPGRGRKEEGKKPQEKGKYMPPAMRRAMEKGGSPSIPGNSLAQRMRQENENERNSTGGMSFGNQGVPGGKRIPGLPSKPEKSKNAIRKERQRAAKLRHEEEKKAKDLEEQEQQEKARQELQVDPEKRAKKIKKLLKQIDELKLRDTLNDDQKKKVANEDGLIRELKSLGLE